MGKIDRDPKHNIRLKENPLLNKPAYKENFYWKIRVIALVFLIMVSMAVLIMMHNTQSRMGKGDFRQYWSAGKLILSNENPYDYAANRNLQTLIGYSEFTIVTFIPPWAVLWISPISLLPFNLAAYVWLALNMILLFVSGTVIWKLMTNHIGCSTSTLFPPVLTVILVMSFYPALYCLTIGQAGIVLLFGVSLFYYLRTRGQHFSAGICLALALIKPHLFSLIWIAIVCEAIRYHRWRTLLGLATALVVSTFFLYNLYPQWVSAYINFKGHPYGIWIGDVSINGLLNVLGYGTSLTKFAPVMIISILFLIYLFRKSDFSLERSLPTVLSFSLFVTPYGWVSDQTLLLVPYLTIFFIARQMSEKFWMALTLGSLGLNVALGVAHRCCIPEYLFFIFPVLLVTFLMVISKVFTLHSSGHNGGFGDKSYH